MQHINCPKCTVTISDPKDFDQSFDCAVCGTPIDSTWAKAEAIKREAKLKAEDDARIKAKQDEQIEKINSTLDAIHSNLDECIAITKDTGEIINKMNTILTKK